MRLALVSRSAQATNLIVSCALLPFSPKLRKGKEKKKTKSTYIRHLRHLNYEPRHPIPITLGIEGGQIIADHHPGDMYGRGSNKEKAINDLCEVIAEYYELLKEDKDKLGPLPKKHWIYLKEMIVNVKTGWVKKNRLYY